SKPPEPRLERRAKPQLLQLLGQERPEAGGAAGGVAEVVSRGCANCGDRIRRASPIAWSSRPPNTGSTRCANRYGSTITSRRGNRAVRTIALATHEAEYCGPIGASVSAKNSVAVLAG